MKFYKILKGLNNFPENLMKFFFADFEKMKILKKLLGKSENIFINLKVFWASSGKISKNCIRTRIKDG